MQAPDLFELFISPLNRIDARYMVTGALASILYGEPRLTTDVDIVVALDQRDVGRLANEFSSSAFYRPPLDVMEAEVARPRHGHFNVIHVETTLKADFYPVDDDPLTAWGMEHRRGLETPRGVIWTAPPEYVIVLKLRYWHEGGSDKHRRDIRSMLRVLGEAVDRSFIGREAERRGLTREWAQVDASG